MFTTKAFLSDPYSSRIADRWQAAPRQEPVIWGTSEVPLPASQIEAFATEGYLSMPQLISTKEATELLEEARRLAEEADPGAPDVIREPDSQIVRSLFRLHRNNDLFRSICKDARVAGIARQILGSEVYVHQSRVNFKPAFNGREFFWHSDFETWHVEDGMPGMRALSVSINLTENNEFNGPLMVIGGSHQIFIRCVGETPKDHFKSSLRKQQYGVPCRDALKMLVESGSGIAAPHGRPGSAVLFDCNTMHGSVGNLSPYPRTNFFVVFNSVENALVEPFGDKPPRPDFLGEREVIPVSEL